MNIETKLKEKIQAAFQVMEVPLTLDQIIIERSKETVHGDFATNVAMQTARILRKSPLVIAQELVKHIDLEGIEKIEVVAPGFINFFLKSDTLSALIKTIITQGETFGTSKHGVGQRINVEFVSANPTGDLHIGHARGAALGDSICRLYEAVGYQVTREFYVNDAGVQIDHLGASLRARYHQAHGLDTPIPEDGYHGPDLIKIAQVMVNEVGDKYLTDSPEATHYFKRRGVELELDKLNQDLKMFRVGFDTFSFETDVRDAGGIEKVLVGVKEYLYVDEGATLLKTTAFGDDKDRVIIKSNGEYTYFLPDIAYHLDKLSRNYVKLVDILGADHHGYIMRMKSALQMFGYPQDILDVELIQMVRLIKDGEEFKMSKRSGNSVTLRDLCEEVGIDAARYFFVSRAASSHLDFDLNLATETTSANPVYYAQYAHARLTTLLESASDLPIDSEGIHLKEPAEKALLKHLGDFPNVVTDAALTRSPYKITTFIQKLASLIHGFYTECRVIDREQVAITSSRLGLVKASQIVLKKALDLIGVSAPAKM